MSAKDYDVTDNDDYLLRDESQVLNRIVTRSTVLNNEDNVESIKKFYGKTDEDIIKSKNTVEKTDGQADGESLKKTKTRLFSSKIKDERKGILLYFCKINLVILIFCLTAFVIIWGCCYHTSSYYHKVNILAVLQDDPINQLENVHESLTQNMAILIPEMAGTWHIYNSTGFCEKYDLNSTSQINDKITELVHHERYWLSLNVKPNITQHLYDTILGKSDKIFNSTDLIQVTYESGRDLIHSRSFIKSLMTTFETTYQKSYTSQYLPTFINNITTNIASSSLNLNNLPSVGKLVFDIYDHRPWYDRIIIIVAQIGCVFALLLTVFQFLVYAPLYGDVYDMISTKNRVVTRIGLSISTHFFASLCWCTVAAIYQVDFTKAFGRGGFMIYWMSTWLFMWAVGGINENVLNIIFAVNPPFLGFWVLGFIIINLSSSFFPMALDSNFYRYGYMMPLHNFVDITKVIFLDLTKQKMGRNYGILVAWIAINTVLLPFDIKLARWIIYRKQRKQ